MAISVTEAAENSLSKTKISTEKVRLEEACESIFLDKSQISTHRKDSLPPAVEPIEKNTSNSFYKYFEGLKRLTVAVMLEEVLNDK